MKAEPIKHDANHTAIYRVRRGLFGVSILQELINSPSNFAGVADLSRRVYKWVDVPYGQAPRALISQFTKELQK